MQRYVPWPLSCPSMYSPFLPHSQTDAEEERVEQLQRRLRRERDELWRLSRGGQSGAAAPLLLRTTEVCMRLPFLFEGLLLALGRF